MIKVYHVKRLTNDQILRVNAFGWDGSPETKRYADITLDGDVKSVTEGWNAGDYDHVGDVEGDDLDVAFEKTNHIDRPWTQNAGVSFKRLDVRSSSVGDVFELNGEYFVVASCGFTKIDLE
jgi:hypothetical protein